MIWALFFVAVFGPGALAGTLAIAVHSIGFTGKFLSEAIEEAKPGPIEALTATGASPLAILLKGYWPQVKPAFSRSRCSAGTSTCAKSAVLGLVGGGGLGMALDTALSNLYWDQVGLVLIVIFVVVIVTEIVTAWVRSRIIDARPNAPLRAVASGQRSRCRAMMNSWTSRSLAYGERYARPSRQHHILETRRDPETGIRHWRPGCPCCEAGVAQDRRSLLLGGAALGSQVPRDFSPLRPARRAQAPPARDRREAATSCCAAAT